MLDVQRRVHTSSGNQNMALKKKVYKHFCHGKNESHGFYIEVYSRNPHELSLYQTRRDINRTQNLFFV